MNLNEKHALALFLEWQKVNDFIYREAYESLLKEMRTSEKALKLLEFTADLDDIEEFAEIVIEDDAERNDYVRFAYYEKGKEPLHRRLKKIAEGYVESANKYHVIRIEDDTFSDAIRVEEGLGIASPVPRCKVELLEEMLREDERLEFQGGYIIPKGTDLDTQLMLYEWNELGIWNDDFGEEGEDGK